MIHDETLSSSGIDLGRPNAARIYDYLLGGKDSYAVDRDAAERVLAVAPDQRRLARANRRFLIRAVRHIARTGVRQFIDLGTGLPTSPSVHETVRESNPSARVVYVDRDPVVMTHNSALLAEDEHILSIQADVREPDHILGNLDLNRLIDFHEPVAVLCAAVLHLMTDEEDPAGIIGRFRAPMAPGSYLVLSQFAAESEPDAMAELRTVAAGTPVETYFRPREAIERFFAGLELLPPGVVYVEQWRPDMASPPTRLKIVGGVGQKV